MIIPGYKSRIARHLLADQRILNPNRKPPELYTARAVQAQEGKRGI